MFGNDGLLLDVSLAVGVMFAIGLLIMALIDLVAMLSAATRLGGGLPARPSPRGWLSCIPAGGQVRLWVSTVAIIGTLALILLVGGIAACAPTDRWEARQPDPSPASCPSS